MEWLQEVSRLAFFGITVLSLVFCVVLSMVYWRRENRDRQQRKQQRTNITDITILFQTMRDVINQQKELAREFNQELDTKMALVKQVLSRSMEKNERLYDKQQRIQQELGESLAQLESLQRQAAYLRDTLDAIEARGATAPPPPQPAPPPSKPAPPPRPAPPQAPAHGPAKAMPAPQPPEPRDAERSAGPKAYVSLDNEVSTPPPPPPKPGPPRNDTMELPFPEDSLHDTGLTDAEFSDWVGLDFEQEARGRAAEDLNEEPYVPEAPEDARAARDAFRALLDIESAPPAHPRAATPGEGFTPGNASWNPAPAESARRPAPKPSGNGRNADPLQRRVLEYHDAGMSIADIAKELGVGKGEVRLLLSLAQQWRR